MSADYRQQQELEEYEQWLNDPVAQAEYQQYLALRKNHESRNIPKTATPF